MFLKCFSCNFKCEIGIFHKLYSGVTTIRCKATSASAIQLEVSKKLKIDAMPYPNIDYANAVPIDKIPGPNGVPLYFGCYFEYRKIPFTDFPLWPLKYRHVGLQERFLDYGPIWAEKFCGKTIIHLSDPEFFRIVLRNEEMPTREIFLKHHEEIVKDFNFLQQRIMKLIFHTEWLKMDDYLPLMSSISDQFVADVKKNRNNSTFLFQDLLTNVGKWQLDSSASIFFEMKMEYLKTNEENLLKYNLDICQLTTDLYYSLPFYRYFSSPKLKKLKKSEEKLDKSFENLIKKSISEIKTQIDNKSLEPGTYKFLGHLIGQHDFTFQDIKRIALSFSTEGIQKTTLMATWALYALAKYPVEQEKIVQEFKTICPNPSEPLSLAVLDQLTLLKAFIKETLRVFPITPYTRRVLEKNLIVGGYQLPSGTLVEMDTFMPLMDDKYFTDPETFKPERWLKGGSETNVNPFAMLPFGYGPRMCIGHRFAEYQVQIVLLKLLQEFRLSWESPNAIGRVYRQYFYPDKPVNVAFHDRNCDS